MEKLLEMLRLLREQKGYSQEYIADKMRVSSSSVSRWETGQSGISLDQLTRYAESLELSPDILLAKYASSKDRLPLYGEIHITVFSDEAYKKILAVVSGLGPLHLTIKTDR